MHSMHNVIYFNPIISLWTPYEIIMHVPWLSEKFAAYTQCVLNATNKQTGLRRVYVGTGTVLSVTNLLLTTVAD